MQQTTTHTHTHAHIYACHLSQSKQALQPRTLTVRPCSQECGELKGKYSDKRLFSYGQLGGVHHILLCLAFVLLYENMRCVWASISIPITTCAWVPWEKYACLLPKERNPRLSWRRDRTQSLNDKGRGAYVLCRGPWFTILPLHPIKKEHQQQT